MPSARTWEAADPWVLSAGGEVEEAHTLVGSCLAQGHEQALVPRAGRAALERFSLTARERMHEEQWIKSRSIHIHASRCEMEAASGAGKKPGATSRSGACSFGTISNLS